jgi:hypothetical protein
VRRAPFIPDRRYVITCGPRPLRNRQRRRCPTPSWPHSAVRSAAGLTSGRSAGPARCGWGTGGSDLALPDVCCVGDEYVNPARTDRRKVPRTASLPRTVKTKVLDLSEVARDYKFTQSSAGRCGSVRARPVFGRAASGRGGRGRQPGRQFLGGIGQWGRRKTFAGERAGQSPSLSFRGGFWARRCCSPVGWRGCDPLTGRSRRKGTDGGAHRPGRRRGSICPI